MRPLLHKAGEIKPRGILLLAILLLSACAHHAPYNQTVQSEPGAPPRTYTVQRGDYVHAIAKKFAVDQDELIQLNHLSPPYTIFPGQILQVPGGQGMQSVAAAVVPAPVESPTTPVERSVDAAPLPPPVPAEKPADVDRASPAALAPQPMPAEPTTEPPTDAATAPATLVWPVHGEIVSTFGPKPGGLHNDGINIAAAEGTPVKAAAAGTIAYAGNELKGFGNLVLIRHEDGWVTAYAHMAEITVRKGATVTAGQPIGTVGQTGTIDSPQLHFELRHGKEAVDPTSRLSS